MRFSQETTKKNNMKKIRLCFKIFFWLRASAWFLIVAFDSEKLCSMFAECTVNLFEKNNNILT